jgi:CubicO group peptidase (beta-lactamase class C family)
MIELEEARARFGIPGVSWAVIEDGEMTAGTLGVRVSSGSDPVTPATRFQACSISKPIAALAMLRLVDRGLLDLDADINDSLTSWRVPRNSDWQPVVTLRQLASHSAGLTTSGFPGYRRTDPLPTTVEILNGVDPANTFGVRVDTIPGTQFRYSGGGTLAMQQLLEDVTRTPFPELMQELVLVPAGMADSDYTQPAPASVHDVLAHGHEELGEPLDGGWRVYPELATAGLWTTPTDLCRYALAVQAAYAGAAEALISQPLARELLTPQVAASDRIGGLAALGLGPFVKEDGSSSRFGHSGGNAGFRCHLLAYRDRAKGAAVMTNSDNGNWFLQHAFGKVAEACDWPGYVGEVAEPAWPDAATMAAHAGTYRLRPDVEIATRPVGHGLEIVFSGQQPLEFGFIGRTDAGALAFGSMSAETTFQLDPDGDGGSITFLQNGEEIVCPRVTDG